MPNSESSGNSIVASSSLEDRKLLRIFLFKIQQAQFDLGPQLTIALAYATLEVFPLISAQTSDILVGRDVTYSADQHICVLRIQRTMVENLKFYSLVKI